MTWLWEVDDMDLRVAFARSNGPTDFLTLLARWVVGRVVFVLTLVLRPVDKVARLLGAGMLAVFSVAGLLVMLALTVIWFPFWLLLMGSSWLWLKCAWSRPILILPGMAVAFSATIYLMLVPDPQKTPEYPKLMQEWPLSWYLWSPPPAYDEKGQPRVGPRRYEPKY